MRNGGGAAKGGRRGRWCNSRNRKYGRQKTDNLHEGKHAQVKRGEVERLSRVNYARDPKHRVKVLNYSIGRTQKRNYLEGFGRAKWADGHFLKNNKKGEKKKHYRLGT